MRIAIVNDQSLAVEAIRRVIEEIPGYEIAWVAENGLAGVEKCLADPPDLVLMDMLMPVMSGVEATKRIMRESPVPVLVVCSSKEGKVSKVFEAMGYGALDAVETPGLGEDEESRLGRETLLKKIKRISMLCCGKKAASEKMGQRKRRIGPVPPIVAVGASTGGPKALCETLSPLPADTDSAVVIVQHVDEAFSDGMSRWLDGQIPMRVKLAARGDAPESGNVYLASSNDHLIVTADTVFAYTPEPREIAYRPSVDVFFESLASNWPETGIAVLLTGMGRDGAVGMAALRKKGWHTIAQDKVTSVVYGMPKAAAELGAAAEILPVDAIGGAIRLRLKRFAGRRNPYAMR